MNLRFIKPSHNFYNQILSNWFKYVYIMEEGLESSMEAQKWNAPDIIKGFIDFSINAFMKSGQWSE